MFTNRKSFMNALKTGALHHFQTYGSLYRSWAVLRFAGHDKKCMQVINTLESRSHRFPDLLASPTVSVSWGTLMPPGLPRWGPTTSSCCWEPDRNLTWWNIAEDVRGPSTQTGRPRLPPSQQLCVSLFDVSGRWRSARCKSNGMRRRGTLCSCKPLFRS